MTIKKSHVFAFTAVIIVAVLIVWKLADNKKEFQNNIAYAQRKVESIPVAVEPVTKGILSEKVVATGTLEASDVLTVVSETQGKIIKIYKEKGDRVASGDIIAKVDDEVIVANVLTAEANYAQYEKDVERLTRLSEENAVTKRDLEQATIGLKKAKADLITAKKALSNTSIKTPIAGYINNDFITEGQLVSGGTQICEVVNNNKLKLNIKITEQEVYKISIGQAVEVNLSVFPGQKFTGKITAIAEKADVAMKFNVEITLNNNTTHLRSGLYAEATLPVKNSETLLINKASIVGSMLNPVVFVVENGKAVKRQLVTGQSNNSQISVISGLTKGEKVIVSGQLNLKDGDDVKIIEKK